jgi:hypothetical protein
MSAPLSPRSSSRTRKVRFFFLCEGFCYAYAVCGSHFWIFVHGVLLVFLPGVLADVVLGFDSLDPYLVSSWCMRSDLQPLISTFGFLRDLVGARVRSARRYFFLVSDFWKSTCAID